MITGRTRLVVLLGHPVSESLSPEMQNVAFTERELDWAYVACDVAPDFSRPRCEASPPPALRART